MFKCKLLTSLAATVAVAVGGYTSNALAASDNGASDAVILVPLSIAHGGGSLDFGTIAPDGGGATVQVDTTGAASVIAGAAVLSGATSADSFTVTGQGGMSYTINLPASTLLISGANAMTVNTFVTNLASPATLPAGAGAQTQTLLVGGNLLVSPAQPAGTYSGIYSVTVNYQ